MARRARNKNIKENKVMPLFIKIEPELHTKHIAYVLTNTAGEAIFVGIRPYKQLLNFLPHELAQELHLTVIDSDDDRLKLYNRFVEWCKDNDQAPLVPQLSNLYKTWLMRGKLRQVMCLDTGEQFDSAKICATKRNLTYGQLLQHLKNVKSFNTVKGKRYEYI